MPEWIYQLLAFVGTSGAIYGGIRADLKAMHERLQRVESVADKAHERIDAALAK